VTVTNIRMGLKTKNSSGRERQIVRGKGIRRKAGESITRDVGRVGP
jgi:hypothetical protein